MIRLRGKRNESTKYFYNGYIYYLDNRGSRTIFRCSRKNDYSCRATIYVESLNNLEHQNHVVVNDHNHPGKPYFLLEEQFSAELEEKARAPDNDFINIFNAVVQKEE